MMTRYRLHYAPDNASLCVRLTLEELGLPYDTVLVDRSVSAQNDPAYLALNPNGLIPVLETPDGAMFETGAILLWLADRHAALAPDPQSPDRADFLKWLFWVANTLHPALRMLFYPEKYSPDHPIEFRESTKLRIEALLDILADGPDLMAPSILQTYVGPLLRWLALYPTNDTAWFDLGRWPSLYTFCKMMDDRPSTLTAIRAEGLGALPFSRPTYPTPPEGSAL